ncbi:MAG: T9SS type A sorting domain-containing protein [bacterium]|nr:T9SS type A sorting domain-containing protein [bacterium]
MNWKLKYGIVVLMFSSAIYGFSQTNINLKLYHTFEGAPFQYGEIYDLDGQSVLFTRVQYYLSGFEITHDGGQMTSMPDTYVLASANVSDYTLGEENITNLEGISFDLGVDSVRNGMNTNAWPAGHPLAAQTPSMDWSWPDGYFFWTIDGKVDSDNDGQPDLNFSLHGMGNHLLRPVNGFSGLNLSGSDVDVELFVNIADWFHEMELRYVGVAHDGLHDNTKVADNTNPETVFTLDNPLSIEEWENQESSIYADYTMPYAPTIYYDLISQEEVDITVVDEAGRIVLAAEDQPSSGNFFIRKELPDGMYIITLTNKVETKNLRFVVKN